MKREKEDALKTVRKAKAGSKSAFDALLQQYGRLVIYHCIKMMGNRADGEDAAQEVFILLHKNISRLQSAEAFTVWLHKLTRHTCMRLKSGVKNKMASQNISLGDMENSLTETKTNRIPEAYLLNADKKEVLLGIIGELPEKMRECILLYYYEDLPVKQIAQILDMNENAINVMLHRARIKIRMEIEQKDAVAYSFALLPFGAITQLLKTDAMQAVSGTTIDTCIKAAGFGNASKKALARALSWAVPMVAAIAFLFLLAPTSKTLSSPQPVNDPQHISAQSDLEDKMSTPVTQPETPLAPNAEPKEASVISTTENENIIVGIVYLDDPASPKGRTWKSVPGTTLQVYSADGTTPISEPIQVGTQNGFRLKVDIAEEFRILVTLPSGTVFAANLSDVSLLSSGSQKAWLTYEGNAILSFAKTTNITGLEVVAYRQAKLAGNVVAEGATALSDITVDLTNAEGRIIATASTDANGHYVFENPPIAKAGQYYITVRFPLPHDLLPGEGQTVYITPGQNMTLPSLTLSLIEDIYKE